MIDLLRFYKQSARDRSSSQLVLFQESLTSSAAIQNITITHTAVPIDKVLLIDSWSVMALPGSGQNVTQFQQRVLAVGISVDINASDAVLAANVVLRRSVPKEYLLFPGDVFSTVVGFNTGAIANTAFSMVRGFLLPRGMWSP